MSAGNPYADLRALLDSTRRLTPEEMAELQLEQGYVDRALRIYDELVREDPSNTSYATRRAWLARMSAVRPVRLVGVSTSDERSPRLLAAARAPRAEPPRERTGTLEGVGPPRLSQPAVVRALPIVRVR